MSSIALSAAASSGPRLRLELAIVEQVFRGETSFVVKDPATQKYFRFRPVEMRVMRCFDGTRPPDEIAAELAGQGLRLTARAVEGFARKLASIGLLERTLAERTTLELERMRTERRKRRRPALFRGELTRMRWSLGDPDRMFDRVLPAVRWMFTRTFVAVSVALLAAYFLILGATWGDFSSTVSQLYSLHTITFGSIVVLWLTGLVVILIHELGHGFACKYFGGEVHEMGFMLIYFQPAFYCNVNDAWSFPTLRARLWVTAAGGWIQLVVASLAAIVWYVATPGTLASEVAVAAMIVGGATTIITNANPLLPLDGYFALTDWLEIPNLRIRAREYFAWWVRRQVLRVDLPEPAASDREKRVFLIYGALAFVYIGALFTLIAFWLVGRAEAAFGAIGVVIVLGLMLTLARRGIMEWGRSIALALRGWRASRRRKLGWRLPAGVALGALVALAVLPWTLTTSGRFVVAPASAVDVTAPDSGLVAAVFVREGMQVPTGAPLAKLVDRDLEREMLAAARAVDSLSVATSRARAAQSAGVVERLEAEQSAAVARFAALQSRLDALTLRARWAGTVTTPRVHEIEGRRVEAGDRVMRLATLDTLEARVALARAGAADVHAGQLVHLIAYGDAAHPVDAVVAAVAPAGAAGQGTIEVRVPVRQANGWRAGATGEASVELRRATALVALWWSIRQKIRNDLLI
jgi:multidrug efflux pump subunit AcrA (membrane-fusion protein)